MWADFLASLDPAPFDSCMQSVFILGFYSLTLIRPKVMVVPTRFDTEQVWIATSDTVTVRLRPTITFELFFNI
jgi:hypothetical protein